MEVALYIRDYMEDPDRPMHQQVEEAAKVCRRAKGLGFLGHLRPPALHFPPDRLDAAHADTGKAGPRGRGSAARDRRFAAALPQPGGPGGAGRHTGQHQQRPVRFRCGHRLPRGGAGRLRHQPARPCQPVRGIPRADEAALERRGGQLRRKALAITERQAGADPGAEAAPSRLDSRAEPRRGATRRCPRRPGRARSAAWVAGHRPADPPSTRRPWTSWARTPPDGSAPTDPSP